MSMSENFAFYPRHSLSDDDKRIAQLTARAEAAEARVLRLEDVLRVAHAALDAASPSFYPKTQTANALEVIAAVLSDTQTPRAEQADTSTNPEVPQTDAVRAYFPAPKPEAAKVSAPRLQPGDLREKLAALAHEQWSGWMRYLFEKARGSLNGTVLIEEPDVIRWKRQLNTPYVDLSEEEKESDRKEADRVLALLPPAPPLTGEVVAKVREALLDPPLAHEFDNSDLSKVKADRDRLRNSRRIALGLLDSIPALPSEPTSPDGER